MKMEPFPGVLEKKLVHYAYRFVLTGNDRYIIYYDDQTERSELFERNLVKDHFTVLEYKE